MTAENIAAMEAARILIRRALQMLRDMIDAGRIGKTPVNKIKIHALGCVPLPCEFKPDWSFEPLRILMALEESPTFIEFERELTQDERFGSRINKLVGTSTTQRRMNASWVLQVLMTGILSVLDDSLEISDEQIDRTWKSVEQSLLADKTEMRCWCVIDNVEVPAGITEILPRVVLKGLNTSEFEDLWNRSSIIQGFYPIHGMSGFGIPNSLTLLEMSAVDDIMVREGEFDLTKASSNFESAESSFDSILASLRLLRPEPIIRLPIVVQIEGPWGGTSMYSTIANRVRPFGKKCTLSEDDIREIQRILKVIYFGKSNLSRAIEVCIRRIGFANTRFSPEDRLLDTMMALEALVLSDSGDPKERGELSFRLALRVAKFLEHDKKNQLRVFDLIRDAYKLRSKVIHGSELKSEETDTIREVELLTKEVTRKCLYVLAEGGTVCWKSIPFD